MAFHVTRLCYKYLKYLILTVLVAFLLQIIIALILFPSENVEHIGNSFKAKRYDVSYVSANKINSVLEDDEDYSRKHSLNLRLEELDFTPMCKVKNRDAISAIHRAKTQNCKKQIMNISCQIQTGSFYPHELTNSCSESTISQGTHLGCYQDEKKQRILTGLYGNHVNTNTPTVCLDICIQAGFTYSGVQYGTECFCGDIKPPSSAIIDDSHCDMQCSGDNSKTCGGYFTMNVFKTGLKKFEAQTPKVSNYDHNKAARIVFLLTLNGRALRQVNRLINVLYRTHHYFYIHVDERQSYLHRELSILEEMFPNVKMAPVRFSTIWGGASLLQMLLTSMRDIIALGWQWDFVINLSESDFPIKSLETIENFLFLNKGLNFVKSHGREVQRFIKKQGLDKTFIECENHMWRVGERKLPRGLTIDGGSDWIALSPDFVNYVIAERDELLLGLDVIFRHTLLPAESFFHTVLRNSKYCNTYVDNNLHVTNWKRKLGCRCQYKHVVDWCGCSPNDFRVEDWSRIQNTQDKQLFFARKFEPIINQQVINKLEQWIGINDHYLISNIDSYWQSLYNSNDLTASSDDTVLTHGNTIIRHNVKLLSEQDCHIQYGEIYEINTYNVNDEYKGNLVAYKAVINQKHVVVETWYKPLSNLILNEGHHVAQYIKTFRVSSDYDQKETTFRNFADILGPFSEPVLMYQLMPFNEKKMENLTLIWLDPTGTVAEVNEIHIEENNLTNHIKPNLKPPLLPGVWVLGLSEGPNVIAQTKFLVTPLEYFSGKEITQKEVSIIHTGAQSSYKNVQTLKFPGFIPDQEEVLLRQNVIKSNSKRLGRDLNEWIDSLSYSFYNILYSCIKSTDKLDSFKCSKIELKDCSLTPWSSMSPDPKGQVGKLNKKTGRLERV